VFQHERGDLGRLPRSKQRRWARLAHTKGTRFAHIEADRAGKPPRLLQSCILVTIEAIAEFRVRDNRPRAALYFLAFRKMRNGSIRY